MIRFAFWFRVSPVCAISEALRSQKNDKAFYEGDSYDRGAAEGDRQRRIQTKMAFSNLFAWLRSRIINGEKQGSRRPDGGTSCYRPVQPRDPREEELARAKAEEYASGQPAVANAHTGFTGMNPPATGAAPVQNGPMTGYVNGGQAAGMGWYGANPGAVNMASGGNISYMPGVTPESGDGYTHIEHILTITSLTSCYEAIECMKNEETLIVTLDLLENDSERIRYQDMLAGAAFTLGCSVRNLQSLGVVIIAPAGVKILPERQERKWFQPQREAEPQPEQGYYPRRERRSSQNPIGWENASNDGQTGYNPYTGTMPAAAGDYGAYGGYYY